MTLRYEMMEAVVNITQCSCWSQNVNCRKLDENSGLADWLAMSFLPQKRLYVC